MPPRVDLLTKRCSLLDLPILPFLAPRIFRPCTRRHIHSRTTQAAKHRSGTFGGVQDSPQENGGGRVLFMGPTAQKHRAHDQPQEFNLSPGNAASLESNWLQGPGRSHVTEPAKSVEEEEFYRRYEVMWNRMPVRRAQLGVCGKQYRHVQLRARQQWLVNGRAKHKASNRNQHNEKRERTEPKWLYKMTKTAFNRQWIIRRAWHKANQRLPLIRPKYARYLLCHFSSHYASFALWHRRFAMLNLRHEEFMKGRRLRLAPQQASKLSANFLRELIEQKSSVTLRLEWEKFHNRRKMEIWPELMIRTLQYHPEKALKMLAGTYSQEPFPPPYAVSDCINFVISHFLRGGPQSQSKNFIRHLCNYLFRLLRIGPKDYIQIYQQSIFLLLSNADNYCVKKLYQILTDIKHPLHQNTLMHFASRLAKCGETDIAFEIVQKLKSYDCDFNSPQMLSLCSTVLNRSNRAPNTSYSESDIFEYMLGCGMQPNYITYRVLIGNLLETGNLSGAWQVHDLMIENGIEPKPFVYAMLLKSSKKEMDSAGIRRVMDMVREKGIRNAYIWTDILHAIFLLLRQRPGTYGQPPQPQKAFHHMLKVYLQNFRVGPLVRIIPWISEESLDSPSLEISPTFQDKLKDPPAPTLAVMITAFLHGLQSPRSVRQFYDHFRNLLSTGDPALADLIQTIHVWNSILMAFGGFGATLEDCPLLVWDMLAPIDAANVNTSSLPANKIKRESALGSNALIDTHYSSSTVGASEAEYLSDESQTLHAPIPTPNVQTLELETREEVRRKPHIPPKPDVYTWSILLKIFIEQRQTRAAERVLAMMQERGVQPNLVTWNTLAGGYARLQDARMTVDVISRLKASGLVPNESTMSSLYKIRDRRGLVQAMKRKELKELDEAKELVNHLQDDIMNSGDNEVPLEFEPEDEENFAVSDIGDSDEFMTIEGIVADSGTQKRAREELETKL